MSKSFPLLHGYPPTPGHTLKRMQKMKINVSQKTGPLCLVSALLMAAASATTVLAAEPPPLSLSGQVKLRALTPQDLKDYKLTNNVQLASGLSTLGIGQPAYLEAFAHIGIAPSSITNVTWALTAKPVGSQAELQPSPLGSNVPTFNMRDRLDLQLAGRTLLRPDVVGQYAVTVTIGTRTNGTTNVTQKITAATYMGQNGCALCHSGGLIATDKYTPWSKTLHSHAFKDGITGVSSDHFGKNCVSCHVTGYDVNAAAANGGFDDIATQVGWTFPTNMSPGNWDAMPAALKNLANIQCEACHGPGSEHAAALGNPTSENWPRIGTTLGAGACAICHDSLTHHYKTAEWKNSMHSIPTTSPSGPGREGCVRCHTAPAFAQYMRKETKLSTTYEAITCAACHEPHSDDYQYQLRMADSLKLADNKTIVTVTNAGKGLLCMNCHMGRRDATNYVEVTAGGSTFGPHHSAQTDMLLGVNAVTYGKDIPSSAHREVIADSCVECHMQPTVAGAAQFKVGGHTFKPTWDGDGTNGPVHLTAACKECHGNIQSFDFPRQDFDGNGVVQGVQTEVKGLLKKLGYLLPPVGVPKETIAINPSWSRQQLRAGFNFLFVHDDGSYGVHNLSYAVGLLKASIADLTGDANNDGLPDTWQLANFGAIDHANAAPSATPAGDGVPNWLKYSLGLNPMVAGITVPDGVVWAGADGTSVINPPGTNTVMKIFTAAEVAFDTMVGKNYQIQAVSTLGGGWQNIGTPMAGTGKPISYVTPMRKNARQFYRVVVTP